MVSKKHLKRTRQSKPKRHVQDDVAFMARCILDLRRRLDRLEKTNAELLRQLALKDAQIQMVLEDKFFKPVIHRSAEPEVANTKVHGEDLTDSVQFPTKGDSDAIEKEEKAANDARAEFERQLAELEEEQKSAHVEEEEVPAETLGDA
jgi:hypothetical protein